MVILRTYRSHAGRDDTYMRIVSTHPEVILMPNASIRVLVVTGTAHRAGGIAETLTEPGS